LSVPHFCTAEAVWAVFIATAIQSTNGFAVQLVAVTTRAVSVNGTQTAESIDRWQTNADYIRRRVANDSAIPPFLTVTSLETNSRTDVARCGGDTPTTSTVFVVLTRLKVVGFVQTNIRASKAAIRNSRKDNPIG